jgi:hypothetical protein
MDENKKLPKGTEVTVNIPFTYTIGEFGYWGDKELLSINDCKKEVISEIEGGVLDNGDEILFKIEIK